jgi:hypothetical protein
VYFDDKRESKAARMLPKSQHMIMAKNQPITGNPCCSPRGFEVQNLMLLLVFETF